MDRIGSLPDELISHVISFLPIKFAVGTSIVSKRWTNIWSSVPILDFDNTLYLHPERNTKGGRNDDENDQGSVIFMRFVEKVISSNHSPNLVKFSLYYSDSLEQSLSRVNGWIQSVILLFKVVEIGMCVSLSFDSDDHKYLELPPCESLEILKIDANVYEGVHMPSAGCFPNLRVFDVTTPILLDDIDFKRNLFPSLPLIEKLTLYGDLMGFRIHCFNITGAALKSLDVDLFSEDSDALAVIDAPNLEYLHLKDSLLAFYDFKNLPAICEVKVDIGCDNEYEDYSIVDGLRIYGNHSIQAIELLKGIRNAKSLMISANTTRALFFAPDKNLPAFHSLTKLELNLYPCGCNLLLRWLESSPNLKFLVLTKEDHREDIDLHGEVNWSAPESVPTCLLSHLKEVEITKLGRLEEEKVLKYLCENAKVLDKITVNAQFLVKDGVLQG